MKIIPISERYFLYRHIREDNNEVFYVGFGTVNPKGKKETTRYPRAYVTRRTTLWGNVVRKTKYKTEIFFESDNFNLITEKEIEFINLYKRRQDGGTLVNFSTGGDHGTMGIKMPLEKVKKHSAFLKEFWKNNQPPASKKIYQYDFEGKLIHCCPSVRELARICNLHIATLRGRIKRKNSCGVKKYDFIYSYKELSKEEVVLLVSYKKAPRRIDGRPLKYSNIKQIDKNGNLIKVWNSLSDIEKSGEFKRFLVGSCLNGKAKSHKGFFWTMD